MKQYIKEAASKLDSFILESKKAALFFDDDPDGVCSGVLLVKYLKKKGIEVVRKLHIDNHAEPFSEEFNKQIGDIDLLVFTDFNINGFGYIEEFKDYVSKNPEVKVVIIDHHIDKGDYSSENVLYLNIQQIQDDIEGGQYCCTKFVFDMVNEIDPFLAKENKWISIPGIIGDHAAETWKEFIQEEIDFDNTKNDDRDDIVTPEVQDDYYLTPYGQVSNLIFYGISKDKKEAVKILEKALNSKNIYDFKSKIQEYDVIQKEVYDYVENYDYFEKNLGEPIKPLSIFEVEIKSAHDIASIVANLIAGKNSEIIFLLFNEIAGGIAHVSCRCQSGKINTGDVMKKAAESIEGANGGGHAKASGAIVPKEAVNDFRKNVYAIVKEMQDGLL